jgi:hypothetical protein
MAKNEILQIVIFALLFGVAAAAMGEKAHSLIKAMDALGHVMLKITSMVMYVAPFAVFSAITAIIAKKGVGILATYATFIGEFYLGLILLWVILIFVGWLLVGPRIQSLLNHIKQPLLLAFSTASSEAAYPKMLEQLERFGCRNRIVSFVLPLGYSFNLDGSMMYMTFASLFIAQAYGVELSFGDQVVMLLTLMITSKGIAGVPRASLVVIAGTIASFGIPEAGLVLLLGVDHVLDMGRSATNVVGNAVAAVAGAQCVCRQRRDCPSIYSVNVPALIPPSHNGSVPDLYAADHHEDVRLKQTKDNLLSLRISNNGATLNDGEASRIFDAFMRGDNARRKQGSGLGLRITQRILQYHGASIQYIAENDNLNVFEVLIPVSTQTV